MMSPSTAMYRAAPARVPDGRSGSRVHLDALYYDKDWKPLD
jgi:hypothetical protein